jgi:outer membrane lipoprotein-sorting protein
MKRTILVLASLLILSPVTAVPGHAETRTAMYEQVMRNPDLSEVVSRFWIKDDMMRVESEADGEKVITIKTKDGLYNYVPSRKMLAKISDYGGTLLPESESPFGYMEYLRRQNAAPAGAEAVNGYDCDIYEFFDEEMGLEGKAWIWKNTQFPVKIQMETPVGRFQSVFRDIKIGQPVPDSMFELPKDVEYIDATDIVETITTLFDRLDEEQS